MGCGQKYAAEQAEEKELERQEEQLIKNGAKFFKRGVFACGAFLEEINDIVEKMIESDVPRLKAEHADLERLKKILKPYVR